MAMCSPTLAPIDRTVSRPTTTAGEILRRGASELASIDRLVLLGEPGSGKSSVMQQLAASVEARVVSAQDFTEGDHPPGHIVFIDALEECRLSEPGRDRIGDVSRTLKQTHYRQWRLACRSISLPPGDAEKLRRAAGDFESWQLELLTIEESVEILQLLGEPDPTALVDRMIEIGGTPLLGNPAMLRLMRDTVSRTGTVITTRSALLEEATRQMAFETNIALAADLERPAPPRIIDVAEKTCLVLLVSNRSDVWRLNSSPPGPHAISLADLVRAGVDTQALTYALDTPIFRGEGGAYIPAHRIVAEYLAGRALARATETADPAQPSIRVDRAIALLTGDDDRPAPALTGIFAWFVTYLAKGVHADRALSLVRANPELLLFHGDPAALPTAHRISLLDALGRGDPWFLRAGRGSSAIGGLAGDDLAPQMAAILTDPADQTHRKVLVLEALATGPRVPALSQVLWNLAINTGRPDWERARAVDAAIHQNSDAADLRRKFYAAFRTEISEAGIQLRVRLLSGLLEDDTVVDDIRKAFKAYAELREGVMGHLWPLEIALEAHPLPALFDEPVEGASEAGGSRSFEADHALNRILVATIAATPALTAERLVTWIAHRGLGPGRSLPADLTLQIGRWLDDDADRPAELYGALLRRSAPDAEWGAVHAYQQLCARPVPEDIRRDAVEALADAAPGPPFERATRIALSLLAPYSDRSELYWRAWDLLSARPEAKSAFTFLTVTPIDTWRVKESERARKQRGLRAERERQRREWFAAHLEDLRTGRARPALWDAAQTYTGYSDEQLQPEIGFARVQMWVGQKSAAAVRAGWAQLATQYPLSIQEQADTSGRRQGNRLSYVAVAWLDDQLEMGVEPEISLELAFALLEGAYMFKDADRRSRLQKIAAVRINRDGPSQLTLLEFWKITLGLQAEELRYLMEVSEAGPSTGAALEQLLREQPELNPQVLRSALVAAARLFSVDKLKELISQARSRALPPEAAAYWALLGFLIDPMRYEQTFDAELADPETHLLFFGPFGSTIEGSLEVGTEVVLYRSERLVERLGPLYPPSAESAAVGNMDQLIAGAIEALAMSPTPAAGDALTRLAERPDLSAWRSLLMHRRAGQAQLRRQTQFRPPHPADVARALQGGPPATPADLRAVLREVLDGLRYDIRHADTSPWRGFWNRPSEGPASPKVENDCRDLLTDRLRDRLQRFRLPARRLETEARSSGDERADLLFIGEDGATIPVEAKRHWHPKVWTAIQDQLLPYTQSAGSNQHGVYIVFWFGIQQGALPSRPSGKSEPITSAPALETALIADLPPSLVGKIDVFVIDVSDPAAEPWGRQASKRRRTAKTRKDVPGS